MVDLVRVQADRLHQVDLDLVAGGDAAQQGGAVRAGVLRDGEDRRDVVARVRVLGGEEGVVEVELAHGDAVGPGGPLGARSGRRCRTRSTRRRCGRPGAPRPGRARRRRARGVSEAAATAALSMTRLMIISATSASTATGSAATSAIFQASCCSRGSGLVARVGADGVELHRMPSWLRSGRCRAGAARDAVMAVSERAQVHGGGGCGERLVAVADRLADQPVLGGGAQQARGLSAAIRRARRGAVRTPSSADAQGGVADRVIDRCVEAGDRRRSRRRRRRSARVSVGVARTRRRARRTRRGRGAGRRGARPGSRAPRAARTARRCSRRETSDTMPVRPRLVSTRPSSASRASAARSGVRETPSRAASSISLSAVPGASRHERISSRSAS